MRIPSMDRNEPCALNHVPYARLKVDGLATDAAQAAVASAREIAERAYRLAEEATETDEFEEWSDENLESIREQVRSKPMAALAMSLLAGAIVGAFLSRW
ncbi:MAG TPA: hypothetical protein VK629_04565 [Steroidobacteraceae bacterium]|nr:hypothetical protein [Steroidobacteraceae bacterium]